jgi:hypothetical protein
LCTEDSDVVVFDCAAHVDVYHKGASR